MQKIIILVFCLSLTLYSAKGQENNIKKPLLGFYYLPGQMLNYDPNISFGAEVFGQKRMSILVNYGFSGKKRDIFRYPTRKYGTVLKYYLQDLAESKVSKMYFALEGSYKKVDQLTPAIDLTNPDIRNLNYHLDVNVSTFHFLIGNNFIFPSGISLDLFAGAGFRHSKNYDVDRPENYKYVMITSYNRLAGTNTSLSVNGGVNLGFTFQRKP